MAHDLTIPPPTWVDTPPRFREMLKRLQGEPSLAVDTESNSLFVYREQVCLIQISVPGADYLVDPLALDDLRGLGPLFSDRRVLKVLHGAEYDLSVLHRDLGFAFANLFDTMWASRILGWPAHGLAALIEEQFGVTLNKKYQRANWGLRPLPPEQLDYARLDTHFLLPLRDIQFQALHQAGRMAQAEHRFGELARTRWEPRGFDPQGFWRLPGARELDDCGRGVLRALFLLRDRLAQAEDIPPFKLIRNQVLLALSESRPHSLDGLRKVRGLGQKNSGRYGGELLRTIREGQHKPLGWEQRPRSCNSSGQGGRPSAECQARYGALRAWRNARAEARGVEPDIVLPNQTLWAVARRNPQDRADLGGDGLLAPWQIQEFGSDLLAVLLSENRP